MALGLLLLTGILLLTLTRHPATTAPPSEDLSLLLVEADRANFSHDISSERIVLERAEQLMGSPEDVADVQRRLAVLDWKYHQRFDDARTRLLRATKAAEPASAWLALARMEQARGRFGAASAAAQEARQVSDSASSEREALTALAAASVGEATRSRLEGRHAVSSALRESFEDLRGIVGRDPGYLDTSRLLLQAALLVEDGPTTLVAWRSYFQVTPDRPAPNLVARAGRELGRLLPDWAGSGAAAEDQIEVIRALAASRLFAEAALVALAPASPMELRENPRVRAVIEYALVLRDIRALTEEHYRQTILGEDARGSWQASLREAVTPLALMIGEEAIESSPVGPPPPVDPRRVGRVGSHVISLLSEHFGAYVSIGETAGYFDLHMGHRVVDETRAIEQYGRRAELRFVALDNMISNGFQSWAWESGAQHGGWNKPYGIYQVRPAYVSGPLKAWRRLHSDEELRDHLRDMETESGLDEERAANDPHAYLPGLAMRLQYQGRTRLLERLRSGGLEGEALRLAFVSALGHAVQQSSIFAHEGRHAIDKLEGEWFRFMRNPEYTAKLAEVAFAPEPRLALQAIISGNIGNSTPHGKANLAIMKGLVGWMRQNAEQIGGLEIERPLLPQLDRLSDEQLCAAFRSMDRLAEAR